MPKDEPTMLMTIGQDVEMICGIGDNDNDDDGEDDPDKKRRMEEEQKRNLAKLKTPSI